jgi:peptidyl-prolyl cis-trans isomerase SurA
MKKNLLTAVLIGCIAFSASSQTLFTFGKYKADAPDFVRAFNKNNQQPASARSQAMHDYLGLYINSRLKIREAYDRGYDTLPQIKSEVDNLRSQIIENYMSDPKAIDRLSKEAFQRSQKDIHVAHIFIADNPSDTGAARKKTNEIVARLAKGEDFLKVAEQYSDDPSAKENKGDINYITVFTLPYEFENIVYSTPPGKYSKPYRSKAGYHIFKNLGERKAFGEIKIQQILLAFPPGVKEESKRKAAVLADSLYKRIQAGDDFSNLASIYSNDIISAAASGNVPAIHVGQYEPAFENLIWSLPSNGAISKPFLSESGYHIVKRISLTPVVTSVADKTNMDELKQRVMGDDRWKTAKDFIYARVKAKPGLQKLPYTDAVLWAITDSMIDYKPAGIGRSMTSSTPLFKIGSNTFYVSDWVGFAQMNRVKADRSGNRPYPEVMDDYTKQMMYQYYRDHLEEYNDEFRTQMTEFRDGNLFFEIMQQEVWNKAQADSAALLSLFEKNKSRYNWKESAEAVIFFCSDDATAKALGEQLKKNPADWKKIAESMNERVVADSGRYEWSQIPGLNKLTPKTGMFTQPVLNSTDNTSSFAYVIRVYTQPSARSFSEAKGLVMNDYQVQLEDEWIKELKKKYPVTIDQAVFSKISK